MRGVIHHNSNSTDRKLVNTETGQLYKVNTEYKSFNTLNILVVIRLKATGEMRHKRDLTQPYKFNKSEHPSHKPKVEAVREKNTNIKKPMKTKCVVLF